MGTAALSAVLYGYFTYASMQAYDNYNSAETTDDAVQFKDEVQLNDLSANIFVGAAGTAVLYWGWSQIKQAQAEDKMVTSNRNRLWSDRLHINPVLQYEEAEEEEFINPVLQYEEAEEEEFINPVLQYEEAE
jgi:hypothetical protein